MSDLTFFGFLWSVAFIAIAGLTIALGEATELTWFALGFHVAAALGWLLVHRVVSRA